MISSTNYSIKFILAFGAIVIGLAGSPSAGGSAETADPGPSDVIAVLPIENLSAAPVPSEGIKTALIESLTQKGLRILSEEAIERFMRGQRLRYIGGITRRTAAALRRETGAGGVLISSVALYEEEPPPKIAIFSRLVSTAAIPRILWMDGVGSAGNDAPGLFELDLVENSGVLIQEAVEHLSASLAGTLASGGTHRNTHKGRDKFQPKFVYRSPLLDTSRSYSVAVLPFLNRGERKHAGDLLSLHFINRLIRVSNFQVIEPGIIRHTLLRTRIIMGDGVSLADARAVFSRAYADLVLGGKVFDYQDFPGEIGQTKVDFSATLIDRTNQEVLWACKSDNTGDAGVWFFGLGQVNTAHGLAAEMVAQAVETITD